MDRGTIQQNCLNFNPRAPCGARRRDLLFFGHFLGFQSTRPVWGATLVLVNNFCNREISIHAPRVGRDVLPPPRGGEEQGFQSTRPVWGATASYRAAQYWYFISIHAPRVGRDALARLSVKVNSYFNPRAPCGARLHVFSEHADYFPFQSTRPVWGATRAQGGTRGSPRHFNPRAPCGARPFSAFLSPSLGRISIHAPRVGRDQNGTPMPVGVPHFNPRAPCGARPAMASQLSAPCLFQSTRPVWGATLMSQFKSHKKSISIHAPRVGRDATYRA